MLLTLSCYPGGGNLPDERLLGQARGQTTAAGPSVLVSAVSKPALRVACWTHGTNETLVLPDRVSGLKEVESLAPIDELLAGGAWGLAMA
jgi:hypothetical protein